MTPQSDQVTNEILQGNLVKLTFKLSIPSTLGTLMLSLNTFIDALFAGQFIGEHALAGISLALPLTAIVNGFTLVIGVGSASVLSRAIGSGNTKTQSKIFGNLIVMSLVISLVITIIGYNFGEELIVFMGGRGEVASASTQYLQTYILGSVFYILSGASSQIMRSEGKIRLDMIFSGVFVFVNILLNYIFTAILNWGIQGIAIATVIALGVHTIVNLIYFISGNSSIPFNPQKFFIAIDLLPEILSIGISSLLFPLLQLLQSYVVFNLISTYGTNNDIAFFAATNELTSFLFIPINGFAQALQPVIGINYGAKNYQRLKKAYLIFGVIGTGLLILIWIPLQLSPTTFLSILLPNVNLTNKDILNFRILSILTPIWPLAFFGNTLFQSLGKAKIVIIVILLRSIVFNVPMMLIFSQKLGLSGIYYGMLFADSLFMLIIFGLTFKEFKELGVMPAETYQS